MSSKSFSRPIFFFSIFRSSSRVNLKSWIFSALVITFFEYRPTWRMSMFPIWILPFFVLGCFLNNLRYKPAVTTTSKSRAFLMPLIARGPLPKMAYCPSGKFNFLNSSNNLLNLFDINNIYSTASMNSGQAPSVGESHFLLYFSIAFFKKK